MKRFLRNLPIKHKLMVLTMAISGIALLLACATFAIYEQTAFRRTMARDFAILADMFDDNVAAGLAFNDPASIEQTLKTLNANQHIVAACVYDKQGEVVATYRRPGTAAEREFRFPSAQPTSQRFGAERLDTFKDIAAAGEVIGVVYIGSDLRELQDRAWGYVIVVGVLLLACLAVVVLLATRLQTMVSGPIVALAKTVAVVAAEKNYSVRATKYNDDEVGRLIEGFNNMLTEIQARDVALQTSHDSLEKRVEVRTAELANSLSLLNATLDSTTDAILAVDMAGKMICHNSKFANLWKFTPEMLDRRDSSEMVAFVAKQIVNADLFLRRYAQLLMHEDNDSFDLLELKDGQIFERYVHSQRVDGKRTGLVITYRDITARKRTEVELAYERDLLRTLLDSSPDQIYFKDVESRFIKSSHAQALNFGAKSAEELVGKTDFDFFSEVHARPAFNDEQEIIRTGRPMIGKIEKETFKDGRGAWVLASKMPIRNKAGEIIGTFGISKDITAIKEAESRLEQVHKQLVEASRQAGMAEVATGVLHNVGNVLNSVNVSATLVTEHVRHTKAANIAKLAALFEEHKSDLAGFLTQDVRGRMIPGYLATLAESIASEQQAVITELDDLRKNVEHIKDIVAMQQAYANTSGVIETIAVADLIEDALRINAGALVRHEVTTTRDYQARPVLTTDKHKIMQILINLVRNAKFACVESGRADKQIIVRTTSDGHRAQIAIIDNGVGIPAENLTRIFGHGFTTRKDGHGFGLHSGALAARELGGSLNVHSDGVGRGATFILELPLPVTPEL
jgi:PAS domain S-box-containing protein